jgi:hypothetical protein
LNVVIEVSPVLLNAAAGCIEVMANEIRRLRNFYQHIEATVMLYED